MLHHLRKGLNIEDLRLGMEVAKIKGKLFCMLLVFFPICGGEELLDTVGIRCREELAINFLFPWKEVILQKVPCQFGELKQPFALRLPVVLPAFSEELQQRQLK